MQHKFLMNWRLSPILKAHLSSSHIFVWLLTRSYRIENPIYLLSSVGLRLLKKTLSMPGCLSITIKEVFTPSCLSTAITKTLPTPTVKKVSDFPFLFSMGKSLTFFYTAVVGVPLLHNILLFPVSIYYRKPFLLLAVGLQLLQKTLPTPGCWSQAITENPFYSRLSVSSYYRKPFLLPADGLQL